MPGSDEERRAARFEKELRELLDRYRVDASVVSYHFWRSEYTRVVLTVFEGVEDKGNTLHELLEYAHDSVHKRYPASCGDELPESERVH